MNGYFDAAVGTPTQQIAAWHAFCTGGSGVTSSGYPNGITFSTEAEVTTINPETGDPVDVVTGTPLTTLGTGNLEMLPTMTQGLVRWRSGVFLNGREVRGRTNIPGVTENLNTVQGQPVDTYIQALTDRATALRVNTAVAFVIYSKKNGQWYTVTSGSGSPKWGVLRSRRD